jgi:hypothetical protein
MRTEAPLELDTFEAIVPGGVRRVTWLVLQEGKWTLVSEVPGARVEQRDAGPKVVWRRHVSLTLPVGSHLSRVESTPKRTPPKDPLAYLLAPKRDTTTETRRSYFVLATSGKLERLAARPG